jgi:DNA-binding transcriptional regulator YiaG
MVSEWEASDELATDFARRLIGVIQARLPKDTD